MTKVCDLAESLSTAHGPCYRRIGVSVDATGKKTPRGERNNLSQEQIATDPGSGTWVSIALKHCQNLYVVDFDTHNLDGCSLHEYCAQLDTARTHTNKGEHHYVYITDIPSDVRRCLQAHGSRSCARSRSSRLTCSKATMCGSQRTALSAASCAQWPGATSRSTSTSRRLTRSRL